MKIDLRYLLTVLIKAQKVAKKLLITITLLSIPGIVSAEEEIQVLTNLSVNVDSLDIDVKESFSGSGQATWDGSTATRTISSDSSSSTLGVTVIKGRFNAGLTALVAGVDPAVVEGSIILGDGTTISSAADADVSRNGYSLRGGYAISDSWSIYAGFTSSSVQAGDTFTFEDDGPFLGVNYIYRTSASTSFNVNVAYSLLDSTIDLKNNTLLNSYQVDGDTDGIRVGLTWLYSLDRGRSFYVRYTYTRLEFDGLASGVSPALATVGDSTVEAERTLSVISLGMGF